MENYPTLNISYKYRKFLLPVGGGVSRLLEGVMAPNVASGDASRNLGKFEVEIEDSKNMGYIVI